MNYYKKRDMTRHLVWALLCFLVLMPDAAMPRMLPTGTHVGTVQFDAIVELNAPKVGTHTLIFVRYWVAPEFYYAATVWAEPHIGGTNFSTYPVTFTIASNKHSFSLHNQVRSEVDSVFPKPLAKRGVFRNMFNDYPIQNIRFAEQEALGVRLYKDDCAHLTETVAGGEETLCLPESTGHGLAAREIARLKLETVDGKAKSLKLLDTSGSVLKHVEYEYRDDGTEAMLLSQKVVLPERLINASIKGKGLTVRKNGKKYELSRIRTSHHAGGRTCKIDYKEMKMGDKLLSLPVSITVCRGDEDAVLRSVRVLNYTLSDKSEEEVNLSAERFAELDTHEAKARELLAKYWLKPKSDVGEEDVQILRQLRSHFERDYLQHRTLGECLKCINKLLSLDLMLHDAVELERHYGQYLRLLSKEGFNRMSLMGGHDMIHTTARWSQFHAADQMLETWIAGVLAENDTVSILRFASSQVKRCRFWTAAKLLEKLLNTSEVMRSERIAAQFLRTKALFALFEIMEGVVKTKMISSAAHSSWASSAIGSAALSESLDMCVADAKELLADTHEPTRKQSAIKKQLDAMELRIQRMKN